MGNRRLIPDTNHYGTYETDVCNEAHGIHAMASMAPMAPMKPMKTPERWWPKGLGENPNSAGGQNETRYAFFGDKKRLAVDRGDGNIQVYDTGDHQISGVQQQQGDVRKVTFTSQHGTVDLKNLKLV